MHSIYSIFIAAEGGDSSKKLFLNALAITKILHAMIEW